MSQLNVLMLSCSSPQDIISAISEIVRQDDQIYRRFGSFTPSIYDTAWVSMIHEEHNGKISWLFPGSFDYILQSQQKDGTWESYASPVDGILNTLASLLTLFVHRSTGQVHSKVDTELSQRINKAREGLASLLECWMVEDTVQVGFEVLVPSLLRQVGKYGVHFEFAGRQRLLDQQSKKTKSFKPEMAYAKQPTTLLHSLEALVGLIDFDQVKHHCSEEVGIFGSPSATAAYLMNCSTWDNRAVKYLKMVVAERGNYGGVPSAFPTCLFEISWALSTLLSRVVILQDLEPSKVEALSSFYKKILRDQGGVIGFAPGVLEDADDTARALLTLHHLGYEIDPTGMIDKFQSSSCFKTYQAERNPSFSANCNVFLALLHSASIEEHRTIIEHTLVFLLSEWAAGEISDKWNLSPLYSFMLLSDALVCLLEKLNEGLLLQLSMSLTEHKVPITLCQILSKTLSIQREDGSCNGSVEETAYSVIIIGRCLSLPWDADLRLHIIEAYDRALHFISAKRLGDNKDTYLWVEKVAYGSAFLRRIYHLTALNMSINQLEWSGNIKKSFRAIEIYNKRMRALFSNLPIFKESHFEYVELAFIEASRFRNRLTEAKHAVFPRNEIPMTKDRYLSYIPIIWTICNQIGGNPLSSDSLWEMILLSMLNYQVDEYMETVVPCLSTSDLELLILRIRESCGLASTPKANDMNFESKPNQNLLPRSTNGSRKRSYEEFKSEGAVSTVTTKYIEHVLHHPATLHMPYQSQKELAIELYNFLIAHITQNFDNSILKASKGVDATFAGTSGRNSSQSTYFKWVHSTAADNTSCPFSFHFFKCLISSCDRSSIEGLRAEYLSQSLARHLAVMCRQYNDYGSAIRDADEDNLNSLDFPEFNGYSAKLPKSEKGLGTNSQNISNAEKGRHAIAKYPTQAMKDELMGLAEFERGCMEIAFKELDRTVRSRSTMSALRVFVNVTDLFGQIYIRKDIASRVKASQ